MTDPFARLGAFMVRWRWVVLAVWLVLLVVVGGFLAPKAPKAVKGGGFIDPDSESAKAAAILDGQFNASTFTSAVVVFHSSSATVDDPGFKGQVTRAADSLSNVRGVRSVQTFYANANPLLVSADRHTTFALVPLEGNEGDIQELVPDLRASVKDISLEHYVTGTPAVNSDLQTTSEKDLQRSEVFTVPIVLILLLLVFRTVVAALLPLLIGVCSIILALGSMYLVSTQTEVSVFALNVTTMIGLGLGIDFSLVMANRFREEVAHGRNVSDAVAITMATAGRSITYSALTVLLAMFVLTLLFNLLVVRSISMGVMLVAFTALLAGMTLLPALLGILGHRLEWLRVVPRGKSRQPGEVGAWYRLSHAIMRRPWLWLTVSLGVLVILALPVRELTLYGATPDIMPADVESTHGVKVMNDAFGQSRLTPIQVVLTAPAQNGVWRPEFLSALKRVSDTAAADPRNDQVFSLATFASSAGVPADRFTSLTPDAIKSVPGAADVLPQFVNSNRASERPAGLYQSPERQHPARDSSVRWCGEQLRRWRWRHLRGLPRCDLAPFAVSGDGRNAGDLHHADDVLPVGVLAAEGHPDEFRFHSRDLWRADAHLSVRLGRSIPGLQQPGRPGHVRPGHPLRDPVRVEYRLRGVHAVAGQGVLPPDPQQRRGRGSRTPEHGGRHHRRRAYPGRHLRLLRDGQRRGG